MNAGERRDNHAKKQMQIQIPKVTSCGIFTVRENLGE
jgi:hypothetical protein